MNDSNIREPIQRRSIETKEKIIDAGFELISQDGYYNTNTTKIAKKAGVSTGIVYQYFNDKHDILIAGLNKHADEVFFPMIDLSAIDFEHEDIISIISEMTDLYIKKHKLSQAAHEELLSMLYTDKQLFEVYCQRELILTHNLTDLLERQKYDLPNMSERVHIIIGMIDSLCKEILYHHHHELNYDVMKELVIKNIMTLLEKN